MQRRTLVSSTASMLVAPWAVRVATQDGNSRDLDAALRRFEALPGTKSYLLHIGPGGSGGRLAVGACNHRGSCSQTARFLLGLADNGAGVVLTLSATVLAIIGPCSPTEDRAHIGCQWDLPVQDG